MQLFLCGVLLSHCVDFNCVYALCRADPLVSPSAQVRGTVFNELDDDKLASVIDFGDFEENFKMGPGVLAGGGALNADVGTLGTRRTKKPERTSLLEHTRLRNIGQWRRGSAGLECWKVDVAEVADTQRLVRFMDLVYLSVWRSLPVDFVH